MVELHLVLDNWEKLSPFIKSSVFLELSTEKQIVLAKRAYKAYKKANP